MSISSKTSADTYFLTTERLAFRWWQPEDLPLAQELWGNPEVTRLFCKDALSADAVKKRLELEIATGEGDGIQYWPIFDVQTGEFVGCCGLREFRGVGAHASEAGKALELGVHLKPEFWSKGFAQEASRAAIDYAFNRCGAQAICAGHHPNNKGSRNALIKLGFIGASTRFYEPTGLMHPWYYKYNTPQPFTTRLADINDLYALALVHFHSIRETFKDLIETYVNARTLDDFENAWRKRIENKECITLALLHGKQIVGFVSAAPCPDVDVDSKTTGELDRIYIHPTAWGHGFGADLLQWCEATLKDQGFKIAKLWVFEVNTRARRFYEKHGYKLDGHEKEGYGAKLLRYEKPL